jgi:hypothetical protein
MTPTRAQTVVVRLPGDGPGISARVDTADDHDVMLVLSLPPERSLPQSPAVVEWMTPTGIHRISGALSPDARDPAVLWLRRDGEEVVQRRDWARVDAVMPVDVRFEDASIGLATTMTLNVSGGGALIQDPVGLPMGAVVTLELHLDGPPVIARGRVVRETAGGAKGIELDEIRESDQDRIVRFVTNRQRSEMRLRPGSK